MKVIKRNGGEVDFSKEKIKLAVLKAFIDVDGEDTSEAKRKACEIANSVESLDKDSITIEEIQEIIENKLMSSQRKDVARAYIEYRHRRDLVRKTNTTDKSILELIEGSSDYWNKENANKDASLVTVQRDYLAGITSTDITKRFLLPPKILKAHEEGILHFHDADYFAQSALANCCLINLEDMLQNGTVINGITIDKPHRLITATTIATQIITAVTSSQYGGATISLTHLAPFVRDSYNLHLKKHLDRGLSKEDATKFAKEDIKKEIEDSVQTFNYQCNSMTTTNGQSPFLSVFMYLNETSEYKEELAMLIEEFLKQRIVGLKNEVGIYITPAFPKLLYVLEDDNTSKEHPYWYLTELAAKCTAKRMVPDYISEKIMLQNKIDDNGNGNVFGCMGCVDGKEITTYKYRGKLYVESFERMWLRMTDSFEIKHQFEESNPNLYIDLEDVLVYDTDNGFVDCKRIIRNVADEWVTLKLSNGRSLKCTPDHLMTTVEGKEIHVKDLKTGQKIMTNSTQKTEESIVFNPDKAWMLGFMLCDGCYSNGIFASIGSDGEDDIEEKFKNVFEKYFNLNVRTVLQERGKKGTYKDLVVYAGDVGEKPRIQNYFTSLFGGIQKKDRHIPNEVFSWDYKSKLAFLAGIIDADGYVNNSGHSKKGATVQVGSTNKELALQQSALAQALGMPSKVYHNKYNGKKSPNSIRYRVEFCLNEDLMNSLVCQKKKDHYEIGVGSSIHINSEVVSVKSCEGDSYSYDLTTESEHFEVSGIRSHNCRSFLTPYLDENGKPKYYGRMNQGVVTLNLVDVALSSDGDKDKFWKLMKERTDLTYEALMIRHNRLKDVKSDIAPILWQHGAYGRLKKGETINKFLYGGYSTISLGYAGLYECVKYMTGESHSHGAGKEFGLEVMQYLNDRCEEWKAKENIDFSVYGSPIESTTYKFASCLKKRFGVIKGITDKDYVTNSYHVNVTEKINPFDKLSVESEYQRLSPGGAISYIETANLTDNTTAVLEVMNYIYNNIMYAELNCKSDYCQKCEYDGEIKVVDDNGELVWECPNCGNRDFNTMDVARRVCGYIGVNLANQGRMNEYQDRYVHLDNHEVDE